MKPINQVRRAQLEIEARRPVCPLTVEVSYAPRSLLACEEGLSGYKCAKDLGPARGGVQGENEKSAARTPCSLDFAVNECPVYKTHGHLLLIVYPELGAPNPSIKS